MQITLDSVVGQTHGLMSAPLGSEIVFVNPGLDKYIGLDEIGRRVWELLSVPVLARNVCDIVSREYQGDVQKIAADILAFLDALRSDGLIDVMEPADAAQA
jgi:hypothetical protein